MSAVAEAPEALVSQPLAGTLFSARREDLRLVKVPKYPIYGPGGRQVGEDSGQTLAFREGKLFVPSDGSGVVLEDGNKADADDVLAWLRSHRLYGDPGGGFFEVKTAAPPVSESETRLVLDNALDAVRLEEILAAERAGWNRSELTGPVEDQIAKIRALEEQMRAEAQAQAEAAKAAKPKPAAKPAAS